MIKVWSIAAVLAGCHIVPPPPLMPLHATTAADERDATTAMIVLGTAGQLLFGGDGWGIALRVEHQETTQTVLGIELTGGRGDQSTYADQSLFRQWLVGLRGYGRSSSDPDGGLALFYGVGLSLTATGLVTGTLDGGVAVAYVNDNAVPLATLGTALAMPLRRGRPFAAPPFEVALGPPEPGMPPPARTTYSTPRTELYIVGGLGLVVPVGETGNQLSLDVSFGRAMRDRSGIGSLSIADAHHFDP